MTADHRRINEHLEDSVPEYYSKNPAVRWLFRRRLNTALRLLRNEGSKSLVDLGCGDGLFIQGVINSRLAIHDLQAIDLHPDVDRLNKVLAPCRFSCRSLEETGFADGQFEAASCLDVLEHFRDLIAPLSEIRRILRAGGCLITSEPTESGLYKFLRLLLKGHLSKNDQQSIDYHFQNAASVEHAITESGFRLAEKRRVPFPWPFDLFHICLFRKI